jgi:N-acetylglucosaminyl-diphospho-decaprenol L-rhamnosyltransferase
VGVPPAVIVPSFAGGDRLARLLESLHAQTLEHAVLVVDNGGGEATRDLLEKRFPNVTRLAPERNLGFGRAVNLAVAATDAPVLVLLNDDVVCEPTFVAELCAALDPRTETVMAAGVLVQRDDPTLIDSAGVVFDRRLFAVDYLFGERVDVLDAPVANPFGPTGAAAAFDRAAFDSVGGFDEHFFAYLEDVDLVARMMAAGGRCRLAPRARGVHEHAATLGAGSRRKSELMGWSRGYTVGKYRLHRRPLRLAEAVLVECAVAGGQLLIDHTVAGVPARLKGFAAGRRVPEQPLPRLPDRPQLGAIDALRGRLRRRRSRRL